MEFIFEVNPKNILTDKQIAEIEEAKKIRSKMLREKYYAENPERKKAAKAYRKKYQKDNKEHLREVQKEWERNNRDKRIRSSEKRRTLKRQLPATLTVEQWEHIKVHFDNSCAYCGADTKLYQDHFMPLSKGGEYTHNNIIPACSFCNGSKSNNNFFTWYRQQPFYSIKRERNILKFLHYKNDKQQLSLII